MHEFGAKVVKIVLGGHGALYPAKARRDSSQPILDAVDAPCQFPTPSFEIVERDRLIRH